MYIFLTTCPPIIGDQPIYLPTLANNQRDLRQGDYSPVLPAMGICLHREFLNHTMVLQNRASVSTGPYTTWPIGFYFSRLDRRLVNGTLPVDTDSVPLISPKIPGPPFD